MKIGKSFVVKSCTVFILSEKLTDSVRSPACVCVCVHCVYELVGKRTLTHGGLIDHIGQRTYSRLRQTLNLDIMNHTRLINLARFSPSLATYKVGGWNTATRIRLQTFVAASLEYALIQTWSGCVPIVRILPVLPISVSFAIIFFFSLVCQFDFGWTGMGPRKHISYAH